MSDTDFHETKETHSHFLPGEFPDISLFIFRVLLKILLLSLVHIDFI